MQHAAQPLKGVTMTMYSVNSRQDCMV